MSYPTIITDEILHKSDLIDDDKIRSDIAETQVEIEMLTQQADGYRLIANSNPSSPQAKMAYFRQVNAELGIMERREFVAFLEAILQARGETAVAAEAEEVPR